MTRDPHCDGCKADDKLRALRRERDELHARLEALGEGREEWRVTGQPTGNFPPYDFTFGNPHEFDREGTSEQRARHFIELTTSVVGGWTDGPYLHQREIRTSPWRPVSRETTP